MADPNLRCQLANAMVATLRPILDGTCSSDIATDMGDVMFSTATEWVPRSKRPRGAQGWCAGPGVEAEINAAWQGGEEAPTRRTPQQQPSKGREDGRNKSSEGVQAAVLNFF